MVQDHEGSGDLARSEGRSVGLETKTSPSRKDSQYPSTGTMDDPCSPRVSIRRNSLRRLEQP